MLGCCLLCLHVLHMAAGGAVTQLCLPFRLCEFLLPQVKLLLFWPPRQDDCSTYCHNLLWMAVLMAVLLGLLQGKNPYGDLDPLGISNQARHSVQAF